MKKLLFVAGALLLAAPITPALAHDDDYYNPYRQHQRDHVEHERLHENFDADHEDAHAQGFWNRREHRNWHRAYGAAHEEFHEDHPNTRHDQWDGYRTNRYNGYYPSYGYYDSTPSIGFSWSFGGR